MYTNHTGEYFQGNHRDVDMMEVGSVIKRGSHRELLQHKGWYVEMWSLQRDSSE